MSHRTLLPVSLVLLCCARADAQVACPWLTEGTAATALGAAPELTVKLVSAQEGSCVFTTQSGAARSTLHIHVGKQPPQPPEMSCPANSPSLAGIGNSAVLCHLPSGSPGDRQLILGQVRGLYFSIALVLSQKDVSPHSAQIQQNAITMIAEQVAGNLF